MDKLVGPGQMVGDEYIVLEDDVNDQITKRVLNTGLTKDITGHTPGTRVVHTNTPPTDLQPTRNAQGMIISDIEVDNPDLDITLVSYRVKEDAFQNAIDTEFTEFIKPPFVGPIQQTPPPAPPIIATPTESDSAAS